MDELNGKIGLRTLEDISDIILHSHNLQETLNNIVELVAGRMSTDVCSIYLLEEESRKLRLMASKGLPPESIGNVTMGTDEGLTGLAVEQRQVVSIQEPQRHPRFRYFAETHEEDLHSFLGIPLLDRKAPIGVIVIQTREPRDFGKAEISALSTIAFQISTVVVNARLLDHIKVKEQESTRIALELEKTRLSLGDPGNSKAKSPQGGFVRGKPAYPGIVSGAPLLLDERLGLADIIDELEVDRQQEHLDLEEALEKTRIQTIYMEKRVAERLSADDAAIFHSHLMILEDRGFCQKLFAEIESGHGAAYALKKVVGNYIEAFEKMEDPYLRERAADMKDIGRRILSNLLGESAQQISHPGILIAREILPSDMASLDHQHLLGIVTETGEQSSHAVLMAKALGIPAVTAAKGALEKIPPDAQLILDARLGVIFINPTEDIREEYRRLREASEKEESRLEELKDLPARTLDGTDIVLRANIGLLADVEIALKNRAEGVGLYRTEFPYMVRTDFPSRDEQYRLYAEVVNSFAGRPVTIRTLDIGGDKALPYFQPPKEDNPFMGWRSVRVSLDQKEVFRTQIEAALMAGIHGPIKLLFPMISGPAEFRACRAVVREAIANLEGEGIDFARDVPLGIMVEVPAAVQLIDLLADEVEFFAVGTNDLIQYTLAADRNNPLVSAYFNPLHPAVLRVIERVAEVAAERGRGLCLCGEMATDPLYLSVLLGMGLREFSLPGPYIPRIKDFLRKLPLEAARQAYREVKLLRESSEIRRHMLKAMAPYLPAPQPPF